MEIKKINLTDFKIKAKKEGVSLTLVSKEGVSLIQLEKADTQKNFTFDRPGEYEVGGVGVVGLRTDSTTVFVLHIEGVSVVYLGDFAGDLSGNQIDEMGPVDVLLANTKAMKMVKALNPSVVIPFGDDKSVAEMVEKIGVSETKQDKLTVTREDLPEETSVVVLG